MFAKSTITLFVLAVGLLSLLSGTSIGSASAYPLTDNPAINPNVDSDDDYMKFLQGNYKRKPETNFGAQNGENFTASTFEPDYLYQNTIQENNSTSENHLASYLYQNNVIIRGIVPSGQHFGPVTWSSHNTIQESNSHSINYFGSRVTQNDVIYDFRN